MANHFSTFVAPGLSSWGGTSAPEFERKPVARATGPKADATVEGAVFEVLVGFKLAHLRTPAGKVYGITPDTPGITDFDAIREGQHYRLDVTAKFARVLQAALIA